MTKDKAMKLALDDLIAEYYMENSSFARRVDDIFKEALVRADEREACARLCESLFDMDDDSCSEASRTLGLNMKVIEYRFKREWDSQQFDTVNEFYMEVEVSGELFYCKKRFHKQIPFEYAKREAEQLIMTDIKRKIFGVMRRRHPSKGEHMICDQCETVAHCTKHGCVPKQPSPVQEPTVWTATRLWNRRELWTCPADIERDLLEGYTTPPAKQQPAVPQGWKLVPVEPTPEMLEEFKRAYKNGDFWRERIHGAVCAMLAAAPEQKGNV